MLINEREESGLALSASNDHFLATRKSQISQSLTKKVGRNMTWRKRRTGLRDRDCTIGVRVCFFFVTSYFVGLEMRGSTEREFLDFPLCLQLSSGILGRWSQFYCIWPEFDDQLLAVRAPLTVITRSIGTTLSN